MGAKVESAGNDTKGIQSAMDDLTTLLRDLTATLADMKKLQAAILKKPDECASSAKQLAGELVALPKAMKDADGIAKTLMKAVVK